MTDSTSTPAEQMLASVQARLTELRAKAARLTTQKKRMRGGVERVASNAPIQRAASTEDVRARLKDALNARAARERNHTSSST